MLKEAQLLRDAGVVPTDETIAEALGTAHIAYTKLIEGLAARNIEVKWRYYTDGKAWLGKALYLWKTARGTQKETTIFWLSAWEGFFKVSIYIPEKARAEVLGLSLDGRVKERIENSKQMGKLKFFPLVFDLCSDELFEDIYRLADFRKALK